MPPPLISSPQAAELELLQQDWSAVRRSEAAAQAHFASMLEGAREEAAAAQAALREQRVRGGGHGRGAHR